jgi:hypothetical protein
MSELRASRMRRCLGLLGLLAGCGSDPAPALQPNPNLTAGTGGMVAVSATAGRGSAGNTSSSTSTAAGSNAVGSAGATGTAGGGAGARAAAGTGGAVAGRGAAAGSGELVSAGAGAGAAGSSGAGGSAGMASAAGSSGAAGATADSAKPPCLEKPSQVIVLGDSYLNWITHTFPDDFTREFGEGYRMYAVGGASMASGGISGFIPDQLTTAISDDADILAAVMTGGGNDILIADSVMYPGSDTCKDRADSSTTKVCQDVVMNAINTAGKMMDTAANAGIKDVIYIYYPHIPGGGFGGMNPNVLLDYSLPMARDICLQAQTRTSGKLRCHFLELQPIFEGQSGWFADDGIHENSMGSAAMAKETVKLMTETCIAQPASSGCCAP